MNAHAPWTRLSSLTFAALLALASGCGDGDGGSGDGGSSSTDGGQDGGVAAEVGAAPDSGTGTADASALDAITVDAATDVSTDLPSAPAADAGIDGPAAPAGPSLSECMEPFAPAGTNLVYYVKGTKAGCTALNGLMQVQGDVYTFTGTPKNDPINSHAQIRFHSSQKPAAGFTQTGVRDATNGVPNAPFEIRFRGTYCQCAGTLVLSEFALDGKAGTVSGTFEGDVDMDCDTAGSPRAFWPVKAKFEKVAFAVFP
jgi:hypothetical protein